MSQETSSWLNKMTLIGFTDKRGRAWHWRASAQGAEPNHYPLAIPVEDVRRRLFAWQAEELDVAKGVPSSVEEATDVDSRGRSIRWVRETDRKAIAANDDWSTLGHFKSGYQPHQYEQWLLNNVATILDDDLSISSAGLLRNRGVAWVEVSVPDNMTVAGVEFRPNLLATTSFDGTIATTYKRTITAVVCDNTMAAAMSEHGNQVKIKHSRNSISRVADTRIALDIVHSTGDDFAAEIRLLTSEKVSDVEWKQIVEQLVPIEEGNKRPGVAQNKRMQLNELYQHDDRVAQWRGTKFGVLQAFSTWDQHMKPTKGATIRAERNMIEALDGSIEAHDRQVLELLTVGTLARPVSLDIGGIAS